MKHVIFIMMLFLIISLPLVACSGSSPPPNGSNQQFRSDPYEILRLDPQCTQKDVQRQYRKQCLMHHPDKKRDAGDSKVKNGNNGDDDFEFKEVQHAYALIGTKEDRRNYDLRRRFNLHSPATSSNDPGSFPRHGFGGQQGMRDMFGGPSTMHFTFGDGVTFKFSGGNDVFRRYRYNNDPFRAASQRSHNRFGDMTEQQSKPHYSQKVSIPLQELYNGKDNVELKLKTSIFERYKAAYTGGVLKPVLIQAGITVLLTWLRSMKVNWLLSLFMFIAIVHTHIPPPPAKETYGTIIKQGWKGGTRLKYNTDDADITFIIQEGKHDTYTRVGNDLRTEVYVSERRLRKGGTLKIHSLCDSRETIKVKLKPRERKVGDIITVKSQGWPKVGARGEEAYGDLQIKICCRVSR